MGILVYTWLHMAVYGYTWQYMDILDYTWLYMLIYWLISVDIITIYLLYDTL